MPWEYDPVTQTYRLVRGRYRCTVRHTAADHWLAVISAAGQGADAYSFDTQAEALAWCVARVAELAASQRR
jgi:hypothetical protein